MPLAIIKVSQLNRFVKSILESTGQLKEVYVKGEISNLSFASSGHVYLTLKDETASVRCIIFSSNVRYLKIVPEDGIEVVVRGYATLYERDGSFSLNISDISPVGEGAAAASLEKLRQKLENQGLFDSRYKKELPCFPSYIGVVTSANGAAVNDIITTAQKRYPLAKIIVSPATVQGDGAVQSIERALNRLVLDGRSNIIIVGRGGGSHEDLSAFNQEVIVRAVAMCPIPIISAVGHENDFSLCDLAADKRAATPTAAAVLATPDKSELIFSLENCKIRLHEAIKISLNDKCKQVKALANCPAFCDKGYIVGVKKEKLAFLTSNFDMIKNNLILKNRDKLESLAFNLDLLSPLKTMCRGYSITYKGENIVTCVQNLSKGDDLKTVMADGMVYSKISKVEKA